MLDKYSDQLDKVLATCLIHKKRLHFAYSKIKQFFPITAEVYYDLNDEDMAFIDQSKVLNIWIPYIPNVLPT